MSTEVCGTSRIVGCRFSLYPMSDRFVDIILGAIQEADTSKVWTETGDVSTCVRGRLEHVFDVMKAIYLHAAKTGEHVVFSGTFSIGCPGDSAGDVYMSEDAVRMNEDIISSIRIEGAAEYALYALGEPEYMKKIANVVDIAKKDGSYGGGIHYATRLAGDVHTIFKTLEQSFEVTQESVSHVVMTVTLSCNSPSNKKQGEAE
ncbi:thiamine-binding protein [Paenibacillus sp. FSL H7-0326]|uniref:YkoF family thiamine/hydroxymethylpyrimidine-binding protein n=1 Tax=Paenibacillus sp. FSL H7-0326 TaxID=1921144 RepID=UPI00096C639D|nr:YkoF family thiamine/hydroxymethylpyrimidine-binding protein [Paenibacillus sp. FSL H7-0326]OMC72129.1 thiamine-binding protein [Paenibacillus sp. FSL H7-0326]